jgi:hypothetical protein
MAETGQTAKVDAGSGAASAPFRLPRTGHLACCRQLAVGDCDVRRKSGAKLVVHLGGPHSTNMARFLTVPIGFILIFGLVIWAILPPESN